MIKIFGAAVALKGIKLWALPSCGIYLFSQVSLVHIWMVKTGAHIFIFQTIIFGIIQNEFKEHLNSILNKPNTNFQEICIFFVCKQMNIWRFQQFYFSKVPLVSVKCTQLCRLMGPFFPFQTNNRISFRLNSWISWHFK